MPPHAAAAPHICAYAANIAGMQAQAEGLAHALAQVSSGGENGSGDDDSDTTPNTPTPANSTTISTATATLPAAAKLLPPALARHFCRVHAPAASTATPHIVIGCGTAGQAAALAAKHRHNAYAVCVQRPTGSPAVWDAIVAPQHDYRHAAPPPNAIPTLGALGRITPARLVARRPAARRKFPAAKQIAVLIGGGNRAYELHAQTLAEQLARVAALSGATLLLTPSRRTPAAALAQVRAAIGTTHFCWDGTGENPYIDMLAAADGFCITADSVNMISEASASGRGIYLLPMPARAGMRAARAARKFAAFHTALQQRGNLRHFTGDAWAFFQAPPLQEATAAARTLWQHYRQARCRA